MEKMLTDLMKLDMPLGEKVVRSVVVYVFLIVALRLAGKREMAQMNAFDLVVLLMLSNTVQNAIIGEDNSLIGGLVGAAVLLVVNVLVVRFLYHHPEVDDVIEGTETELVRDGQFVEEALKKELVTEKEIMTVIRDQGVAELKDVKSATLEHTGKISVIQRQPTEEEQRLNEVLQRLERIERHLLSTQKS